MMQDLIVPNCCRDTLKRNYNLQKFYLEVLLEDVASYDEALMDCLYKKPSEHLPLVCISHYFIPSSVILLIVLKVVLLQPNMQCILFAS